MGKILYFWYIVPCPLDMIRTLHQISQVVCFLCQCHFVGGREDTAGFPEAPAGARLEMENRQLG